MRSNRFPFDEAIEDDYEETILNKVILYKGVLPTSGTCSIVIGDTTYKVPFDRCNIHGILKEYYCDGQLKKVKQYTRGVPNGIYISYHENGKSKAIGAFKDGTAYGSWSFYSEDGKLTNEIKY